MWKGFTWLTAASYFRPSIGCLVHNVVSSSECVVKWNVTVIDEWNRCARK
jgi:hypothetical protein